VHTLSQKHAIDINYRLIIEFHCTHVLSSAISTYYNASFDTWLWYIGIIAYFTRMFNSTLRKAIFIICIYVFVYVRRTDTFVNLMWTEHTKNLIFSVRKHGVITVNKVFNNFCVFYIVSLRSPVQTLLTARCMLHSPCLLRRGLRLVVSPSAPMRRDVPCCAMFATDLSAPTAHLWFHNNFPRTVDHPVARWP